MKIFLTCFAFLFVVNVHSQNSATAQAKDYFNKGAGYYQNEDYTKAIEYFSKALEFRTKMSDTYLLCDIYLSRAAAHMNLGSTSALADANEAVKLKPEYARAYFIRGLIQEKVMHDLDKALFDADSA